MVSDLSNKEFQQFLELKRQVLRDTLDRTKNQEGIYDFTLYDTLNKMADIYMNWLANNRSK